MNTKATRYTHIYIYSLTYYDLHGAYLGTDVKEAINIAAYAFTRKNTNTSQKVMNMSAGRLYSKILISLI